MVFIESMSAMVLVVLKDCSWYNFLKDNILAILIGWEILRCLVKLKVIHLIHYIVSIEHSLALLAFMEAYI